MRKLTGIFIFLLFLQCCTILSQVTQQWAKRYNGSGNSIDLPRKVLTDKATGDVYVTGYAYNSLGNTDIVTIKYNSAGAQQWLRSYNGIPNGGDDATDMAFDNLGGLIITGTSSGIGTGYDCITIKYKLNGDLQWIKRYNGTANGHDAGMAITPDLQGGVIITGRSPGRLQGVDSYNDIITIKYDYFGNQEWIQRYNGPSNFIDEGNAVTIDDENNVYVTGAVYNSSTGYDMVIIKYAFQGNIEWVRTITEPATGSGYEIMNSYKYREVICVGPGSGGTDILCYDYAGNQKWRLSDFGAMNVSSAVLDDKYSMLYAIGSTTQNGTSDYMIIAYNIYAQGLSWFDIYDGAGSGYDYPNAVTTDNNGNIYVTGYSAGASGMAEMTTLKYGLNSVRQWEKRYNNTGTGSHVAVSVSADNNNNVCITGYSHNISGNYDYATVKYSQGIVLGRESSILPENFKLYQNYPNPFNPSTTIKFDMPEDGIIKLAVYDMLGREVQTLVNEFRTAGSYDVSFDASGLSSGTYFYKIQSGSFTGIKKMILIK